MLGDWNYLTENKLGPSDQRAQRAWFTGARHVLRRILEDRETPETVAGEVEAIADEANKRLSERPRIRKRR